MFIWVDQFKSFDIVMVEEITNAIDDRKSTLGVFIDLKQAFDTVDHDILIKKNYSIME